MIPYTVQSVRTGCGFAKDRCTKSLGKIWNGAGEKEFPLSRERMIVWMRPLTFGVAKPSVTCAAVGTDGKWGVAHGKCQKPQGPR